MRFTAVTLFPELVQAACGFGIMGRALARGLWALDNAHITMHLSGRSQQTMFGLAVERLLRNLDRHEKGLSPEPLYDPARGY